MDRKFDVLIVGSGVAGLYTALNLREDLKVAIITKTTLDECNTYLAQGGISTALNKADEEAFVEDTLKAGQYKNDVKAVRILAKESIENINILEKMGVDFDKKGESFDYTREGAHRVNRIVHYKDYTGKRVFQTLSFEVKKRKNIKVIEECSMIDLLSKDNKVLGIIGVKDKESFNIRAKVVILATGGIGALFKNSTNQKTITGDGISIALKHNIKVKNLQYIQFHPTGLYEENKVGRNFLISESLRGEGAKLINKNKERFIDELLPRNVVAAAILKEEEKTKCPYVYLDISAMDKEFVVNRFPGIYKGCLERGVDITKGFIPVTPVQHYFMGGIDVDEFGRTSMKNLYATGEVSCTGVHGANRLASNSLLEALVFSRRATKDINSNIDFIDLLDSAFHMNLTEAYEFMEDNKKVALNKFKEVLGDKKNELVSC
ncbi:L-aspartate oxidase [Haloimpatiens sp. FM7315]|uniref:L-aspartate oxidase n=1 Tax=Haloimpatiens sp. FM7315 TaxID=3298609 RepID=UPI0035A2E72C